MNAALLVRNLRPVVQLDKDDLDHATAFRGAVRRVAGMECETWGYSLGTLVWIRSRRLPSEVQRALRALRALPPSASVRDIAPHTRVCLGLRCPTGALFEPANAFRVLFSVQAPDESVWSFKQQMCVDPSQTSALMRELLGYSKVADEMGFTTMEMRVVKLHPRFLSAVRGPSP